MARTAERPTELTDEEQNGELLDDLAQEATPAVSDRRRRRQMKRGDVPQPASEPLTPARKERPTPSKREEHQRSRNPVIRFFQGLVEYFRETRVELRKVAWPSREEIARLTGIVVAVTIVSAIFLGVVSIVFSALTAEIASGSSGPLPAIVAIALLIGVTAVWLMRDRIWGGGE